MSEDTPQKTPRVFGIGLSRTGTRSLVSALRVLGYRAVHWPQSMEEIDQAEAAADITVACRYKFLDATYPGSRFICTVRNLEQWMRSIKAHYAELRRKRSLFAQEAEFLCYGGTKFREAEFQRAWCNHVMGIAEHFASRADDLLWFDVSYGWEHLCKFLGKPVPDKPFPWANRRF